MRSEFEFIRNIKRKYGLNHVGDDCAVVPKDSKTDLVLTADLLVEDIDFRLEWTTPERLGHKALAVSLSDIAAMGATPRFAMLTIGIPERVWKSRFLDKFYAGWFELGDPHNIELIGGDISRSPDKVVLDSIVIGEVGKGSAVLRSGARPGDSIFVTGALGGAAGGLRLLQSGAKRSGAKLNRLIERQLCPTPRVQTGAYLSRKQFATAMIDISDGLAADLHHICEASGVGARLEGNRIPIDPALERFAEDRMRFALGGGEDFELLFTSRRKKISRRNLPDITRIGEITSNRGIVELVTESGIELLPSAGYQHF